ncbi:MAG: hypothetical protein VZR00_00535 [Lachnospiraceae bacterium]|jgi:hypothetical protein|nr:hypothetical protein [Lachnospiraceae bacterium]MEE3460362.1 hypothetical protein [Lachnospiraceae bacterium]
MEKNKSSIRPMILALALTVLCGVLMTAGLRHAKADDTQVSKYFTGINFNNNGVISGLSNYLNASSCCYDKIYYEAEGQFGKPELYKVISIDPSSKKMTIRKAA